MDADPARLEAGRHVVLPRGIPGPPGLARGEVRKRLRGELGVTPDQLLVLSIGRLVRDKGVFELLDALSAAGKKDPRLVSVLVGGKPGFDEESAVEERRRNDPVLARSVRLMPAVPPEKVWELLCAADLFAFASHREGMPNSLLEAMAMGVPAVAFAIPPVREIEGGKGAPVLVPPLDAAAFAEALLRLASSSEERRRTGEAGRARVLERFSVRKNMASALERLSSRGAPRQPAALPAASRSAG